jgi:hypothetical protein
MEKKIVGYIPRFLYKLYLNLKERFDPALKIPEEEKLCVEICKKLINDDDSKLTFAPISNKRIIKNENKEIYIVIETYNITIINHVYSYSIYLSSANDYKDIVNSFDKILENQRQLLEQEIRFNITQSLTKILEKV